MFSNARLVTVYPDMATLNPKCLLENILSIEFASGLFCYQMPKLLSLLEVKPNRAKLGLSSTCLFGKLVHNVPVSFDVVFKPCPEVFTGVDLDLNSIST